MQMMAEMMEVELPKNVNVVIRTGGAFVWRNDLMDPAKIQRWLYSGWLGALAAAPEMLGTNNDMTADRENGVFCDNFRGVWGAVDGSYSMVIEMWDAQTCVFCPGFGQLSGAGGVRGVRPASGR